MKKSKAETIRIPVTMKEQEFRSFALFDTFIRQRRILAPLAFAIIMCGFASVCFIFRRHAQQAELLGTILLIIGLGLPAVYFLNFLSSVREQAKRMKLSSTPTVYTLSFSPNGFSASSAKERMHYSWERICRVYSRKNCAYVYTDNGRAYLLPFRLDASAEAVRLLEENCPGAFKHTPGRR
ncbi:MAG: YcxB family protein [Eubacteriales bacterium]|nr:YcxB family protein [Eubacteriales bacterium]